jgi:hypothetical protein
MLSRAVVVTTIGSFRALAALARGHYVVFQFAGRIVTDPRHEADLMIDEDECRVFRGERLVGADLIRHWFLLLGETGYSLQLGC